MKKFFVVPALVLGFVFSVANVTAKENSNNLVEAVIVQDEYIEVAIENLPQPILDAVASDFAGAVISSAAAKEDASEFKLMLAKEDGEVVEVYADADGNWITKE
ncbi:hypothetical protein NBT05_03330 [Aquimarina sp. ERC-38]|uniref:hypothetical protein n=1 Tax=Aquimarina sp. ERC-38 TaxID=2949996 RepID=UPI0022480D0D|nr:hypothetical protein [Aquimarina sp. ERC-38]UZO81513.1 hypothetical protein NBT05_03330 [Aquimarina sp. ERC-38]